MVFKLTDPTYSLFESGVEEAVSRGLLVYPNVSGWLTASVTCDADFEVCSFVPIQQPLLREWPDEMMEAGTFEVNTKGCSSAWVEE
jgi:hypothetical protein